MYFVGFYCIRFSIKLVKNQACNEDQWNFATSSQEVVPAKRTREKHMLEAEELSARLHFTSTLRDRPSRKVPTKLFAWRILSVTFLPFTHTIYTLITHKSVGGYWLKTLERFLQHTHPCLERSTHPLVRNHCSLFSEKTPKSLLVVGAWRAQLHWAD